MSTPPPDPAVRPIDHLALCGAPGDPALILRDRTLSFEELNARVGRLAGWLQAQAPEPGARIASWCAKGELTCLLPLAAPRAELVHVPINPLLKRAQAAHILADSGAAMLIASEARLASFAVGDSGAAQLWEESEALGAAETLGSSLDPSAAAPGDIAAILYTSGSTGQPKGVVLSHANLWLGAVSVAHYLELTPSDRVLAVLPLAFDYGQSQLLSSWKAGAAAIPLDYLTPRDVVKACARHWVTTLAGVPPLWHQLLEAEWPAAAAETLRRLTNSGGALTPALVRSLRARFPAARLFAMYGLTEAFRSTYLDPALIDAHPTSIGTAIPFAEVLVIGDDGLPAADDEEGELVHCGPLVAGGYWRDPLRSGERFRPAPAASRYGGTAVWSGDRVRRDRAGLLHFAGRRDAQIKTAGNRVSPQEVEDAAIATGLVTQAVALGVPDPRLGQAIHLVARPAVARSRAEAELLPALKAVLPGFMVPRTITWRDDMPLNPNGKLDRARLAAERERCG